MPDIAPQTTSRPAWLKDARQMALTGQTFAVVAMVLLIMAVIARGGTVFALALFESETTWQQRTHEVGRVLISLLPTLLFLEAVNKLRQALQRFGNGEFFSQRGATLVAEAGSYGVQAMVAVMLITPTLLQWVEREGGIGLRLEPEYLGMLAFAIFVCVTGKVLSAATELKTENDAFV